MKNRCIYTSYSIYYDRGDKICFLYIQNVRKYGGTNSTLSHLVHLKFLEGELFLRMFGCCESENLIFTCTA